MTILDKLKSIFEGKFGDVFSNNKFNIYILSGNPKNTLELNKEKISIDISKATAQEKKLIKENIIDADFHEKGIFLTDATVEKTRQIKRNLPRETDLELLEFYKDKLSPDMYKALELSLTVRNSFKSKEDITELKRDIASKYPSFGNNLCNLTTRGYFDQHFKELFNSMRDDEDFDILAYQRKVEKIVRSLPYIVFITRYKSYDELSGEVRFKLEKLRKYGTGLLLLHGLGTANVATTLTILEEYKSDTTIRIETDMNLKKTIITATLKF